MYWSHLKLIAVLLVLDSLAFGAAQITRVQCGTVGHNSTTPAAGDVPTGRRFYLNTQSPAPCNGTVTTWTFCYYQSDNTDALEYAAPFAVYRVVGDNYDRVSDVHVISVLNADIGTDSFTCRNITTSPFTIQKGDVVAACIHDVDRNGGDADDQIQLNLVGNDVNAEGYSLMSRNPSGGYCAASGTLSITQRFDANVNLRNDSRILHLYANIENSVSATTMEQTTTLETTIGNSDSSKTETVTVATSTIVVNPNSDGNNSNNSTIIGAVVGAIVAIILISIIITLVVLMVVAFVERKRKTVSWNTNNAIDNAVYDTQNSNFEERSKLGTIASAYEVPSISQSQHDYSDTSLTHTYEYTSWNPYEEVASKPPLPVYVSPLDSPAISFSALLKKNEQFDIYGDLEPYRPPSTQGSIELYGMIESFGIINIPRTAISSTGFLGSGQFANVEEGTWKKGVNKEVRVALKTTKEGATEEKKIKFLQEAAIMAQFRHPNVVSLYGVVSKGDPVVLVTELLHKGDLRHYLHSIRPDHGEMPPADLPKLLLNFCQQVALGMQYLSGKGFVHRDLAARNILVSDNKICKVSDFGMSRNLADETYYVAHGGKIPVKWTAPEALNFKKYSTASDVWSYGCLLYEIWSLGWKPFDRISNGEAISLVESGRRLPPPPGCPRLIYQLMILCWNPASSPRPSFRDIVLTLVANQNLVLSIPEEAAQTHQLAGVLGAQLEAGERMYEELQNTYINQGGAPKVNDNNDNDYEEFD